MGLTVAVAGGILSLIGSTVGVTYWVEHTKADKIAVEKKADAIQVAGSIKDARAEIYNAQIRAMQRDVRKIKALEERNEATAYDRDIKQQLIDDIKFIEGEKSRLYK